MTLTQLFKLYSIKWKDDMNHEVGRVWNDVVVCYSTVL